MSKLYSLKDYIHDMGLTINDFKKLDTETQNKWRLAHQKKLKQLIIERDETYNKYLQENI